MSNLIEEQAALIKLLVQTLTAVSVYLKRSLSYVADPATEELNVEVTLALDAASTHARRQAALKGKK